MEQLRSHWKDFHEILYCRTFRKSVEKIQVSLKSDMNNKHFLWRPIYIFDHISLKSSQNENYFGQKFQRNTKHAFYVQKHVLKNRALYEIMWKNIVQRGRSQTSIWLMRIACWIPKATTSHTSCVIFIAFPLQIWLHESATTLPYT